MKINKFIQNYDYCEIAQSNPLRWVILHREMKDVFTEQCGEFRCKDFFNEIVSKYNGFNTQIYGFNAGNMQVNEEGLYVRLKNLVDKSIFVKNVGSINSFSAKESLPPLEVLDDKEALASNELILLIPRKYFDSTWTTSLVTYLIRVSNVAAEITDWTNHPSKPKDNPFGGLYSKILAQGFKIPTVPVKTFYYVGEGHTNPKGVIAQYVHNNGCLNWMSSQGIYS